MDMIKASSTLCRSSQPLLSFLVPTIPRTLPSTSSTAISVARHCKGHRNQCPSLQTFSTTASRKQQRAAAAHSQRDDDDAPFDWSNFADTASRSPPSVTNEIASLLDSSLDGKKGTPTAPASRTSRFSSPNARAKNPPSGGLANETEQSGSVSNLDDYLTSPRTPRALASDPSPMDVEKMLGGFDKSARAEQLKQYEEPKAMKLGPTVGRTVEVNLQRNMDVGRAFRQLEITCARNSVRRDMMKQRFHERPGMRRKRLKSERWRKNFKQNFSGIVQLVQKMKRQGW